ncbi:hypothetical protein BU16DRAFT_545207 [Lophium mytilinum]|uniref:Uncharacterized protein n=1 Tax=Lophium mytilinum TaxID=390894 RepID=A0A6A6Q8X3_9PEZI|nr:hypothetical protein BU16DRAFT_545207 [Lophium mytilinum]
MQDVTENALAAADTNAKATGIAALRLVVTVLVFVDEREVGAGELIIISRKNSGPSTFVHVWTIVERFRNNFHGRARGRASVHEGDTVSTPAVARDMKVSTVDEPCSYKYYAKILKAGQGPTTYLRLLHQLHYPRQGGTFVVALKHVQDLLYVVGLMAILASLGVAKTAVPFTSLTRRTPMYSIDCEIGWIIASGTFFAPTMMLSITAMA